MSSALPRLAVALVRGWTRLYTWRMPPDLRDERRAEVESDLWESQSDAAGPGVRAGLQILLRLVIGIPDDLGWRVEQSAADDALTPRFVALSGRVAGAALFIFTSWVIQADASRTPPAVATAHPAAFNEAIAATTMTRTLPRLTAGIMATVGVSMHPAAQSAPNSAGPPVFETASVKENKSGDPGARMSPQPGGLFTATNVTLNLLIRFSYQQAATPRNLAPFEVSGGPSWLGSDRFDITAKAAGDVPLTQLRQLLRTLLTERFKLRVHHEPRELPVYRLVTARSDGRLGPQLRRTTADCAHLPEDSARWGEPGGGPTCGFFGVSPTIDMASGRSNQSFRGMTMEGITTYLKEFLGRAVIDGTGLSGYFDGDFEFTAEIAIPPPPPGLPNPYAGQTFPSIFSVLPQQLGLKLDPTRGPVDVLVVDSAEKPTTD
jgi:uncharacterized protein (TIGR03435 family)